MYRVLLWRQNSQAKTGGGDQTKNHLPPHLYPMWKAGGRKPAGRAVEDECWRHLQECHEVGRPDWGWSEQEGGADRPQEHRDPRTQTSQMRRLQKRRGQSPAASRYIYIGGTRHIG